VRRLGSSSVLLVDAGLAANTYSAVLMRYLTKCTLVIARQWFGFERHTSAQRQGRARRLRAMPRSLDQS